MQRISNKWPWDYGEQLMLKYHWNKKQGLTTRGEPEDVSFLPLDCEPSPKDLSFYPSTTGGKAKLLYKINIISI